MDHESEQDVLQAAMTTAEHTSLGNVLEIIRRLEDLRAQGLTPTQICEHIQQTHPNRPGGGPWSPDAVERVLSIADANRPASVHDNSEGGGSADPNQTVFAPAPIHPPSPAPINPPAAGPPNRHTADQPAPPQPTGSNDVRTSAPLRTEPRRYHQRPTVQRDELIDLNRQRRWPMIVGLITLLALIAVAAGLYRLGTLDQFISSTDEQAKPAADNESSAADNLSSEASGADNGEPGEAEGGDQDPAANDDGADADAENNNATEAADTVADDNDSLTIRIEPSAPETDNSIAPATATIRTDGKLYVEGAFRSEAEAEQFLQSAANVFGEEAVVSQYEINPTAPDPTVSDVVLEKPVLFESGSAVIDPEYIPFLEACGDVLKLNSHIVMSVSAFTDASGDAELNMRLSQQRADAVIDFYRNLDIGDDQLISVGYGETDFVAENETAAGRQQNRRAMLELLNVMTEG